MAETLMVTAALLLALYGCVELIRRLVIHIMKPSPVKAGVLVLPLSGHRDDVEFLVRSLEAQSRWAADMADITLLVDNGMDAETRAIVENFCHRHDRIRLGEAGHLEELLKKQQAGG